MTKQEGMKITPLAAKFANRGPAGRKYDWMGWGFVIVELRTRIGLSQELFGMLLGDYTRGQIARYERKESEPPVDFWVKMSRAFGLNINWAFTGKGKSYIDQFGDSVERINVDFLQDINQQKAEFWDLCQTEIKAG